jgi:hypothetical protein
MKHNYNFFYHHNTYTKEWAAMTADSIGHYSNRDFKKGNFAFGKTMAEASENLTIKMETEQLV